MITLSPRGKAHRALTALSSGPLMATELITAAQTQPGRKGASKAWFTIQALLDAGLIALDDRLYIITPDGLDALTCLECGGAAVVASGRPGVRYFGERRAA